MYIAIAIKFCFVLKINARSKKTCEAKGGYVSAALQ